MDEIWHGTAGGYNNHSCRCVECRAAWAEHIRLGGYNRRYLYAITKQAGIALWEGQHRACAICGTPLQHPFESGAGETPCLDHDHNTDMVRGWLCTGCNRGLGYFYDDPERLVAAAAYLCDTSASFSFTDATQSWAPYRRKR